MEVVARAVTTAAVVKEGVARAAEERVALRVETATRVPEGRPATEPRGVQRARMEVRRAGATTEVVVRVAAARVDAWAEGARVEAAWGGASWVAARSGSERRVARRAAVQREAGPTGVAARAMEVVERAAEARAAEARAAVARAG